MYQFLSYVYSLFGNWIQLVQLHHEYTRRLQALKRAPRPVATVHRNTAGTL
jgi:hypothetical protein